MGGLLPARTARAAAGRHPCRHRHEPARPHGAEAMALGRAMRFCRGFRPSLLMSHFVAPKSRTNPVNARQIEVFAARPRRRFAGASRRRSSNSSGIFLARRAASRSRSARLRALRRQSDAGRLNPMRAGGEAGGTHPAAAVHRGGRDRRLQWHAGRRAAPARLATSQSAMPTAFRARQRTASKRRREAGGEAIVGGVRCPIAGRISMDSIVLDVTACPEGAVAARRTGHAARRRSHGRRTGFPGRHDRL